MNRFARRFLSPFRPRAAARLAAAALLAALPALARVPATNAPAGRVYPPSGDPFLDAWHERWSPGGAAAAFEAFRRLLAEPGKLPAPRRDRDRDLAHQVDLALRMLGEAGRAGESDAFLESVVAAHPFPPPAAGDSAEKQESEADAAEARIAAARGWLRAEHDGSFAEDGSFVRGGRDWDAPANVFERDRARALRVLDGLRPEAGRLPPRTRTLLWSALADVLAAGRLPGRNGRPDRPRSQRSGALLRRTDPGAELPTPEPGLAPRGRENAFLAPVRPDGSPAIHAVPESWDAAADDGERWRWALARLAETDERAAAVRLQAWVCDQFGSSSLDGLDPRDFDLPSLAPDEALARLEDGPRRFRLPPDLVPDRIAERSREWHGLGFWHESRRQYDRAAEAYRKIPAGQWEKKLLLSAILDPWVEPHVDRRATPEAPPSFEILYRNATNATFELRPFDRRAVAEDAAAHIRSGPLRVDPDRVRLSLSTSVHGEIDAARLGPPALSWSVPLDPGEGRFAKTARIVAPRALPAGSYLLRAEADGGSRLHAMLEVSDTVLLAAPPNAAPAEGQASVLVADAVDSHPVEGARVRLVRWDYPEREGPLQVDENGALPDEGILHWEETALTDANGVACLPWHVRAGEAFPYYEYLWIAEGPGDRFVATRHAVGYGLRGPRVWRPGADDLDRPIRFVVEGGGSVTSVGTEPVPEDARGAPVSSPADAAALSLAAEPDAAAPGETVRLRLRAARPDSWVLLTTRAGTDRAESRWIHLDGDEAEIEFTPDEGDAPNVFAEALAFHDGRRLLSVAGVAVAAPGAEDPGWHWSYHPRRGCTLDYGGGSVFVKGDSSAMPRLFDFPRRPRGSGAAGPP